MEHLEYSVWLCACPLCLVACAREQEAVSVYELYRTGCQKAPARLADSLTCCVLLPRDEHCHRHVCETFLEGQGQGRGKRRTLYAVVPHTSHGSHAADERESLHYLTLIGGRSVPLCSIVG
jgi:hypothetical protein